MDYGYELTMDANGFLYCTGSTRSFGQGNEDLVLVKFAPDGTRIWNTTWGGSSTDLGWDVVMDGNGALYCIGYTNSFGAGGSDLALVKFSPTGLLLCHITWGGSSTDNGAGVAVDANGSIYCTGRTSSFGAGSFDLMLIKFSFSCPGGCDLLIILISIIVPVICILVLVILLRRRKKKKKTA